MGKGDKKTRRGKIIIGSFGVRRRKRSAGKSAPDSGIKESPVKEVRPVPSVEEVLQEAVAIPLVTEPETAPPAAPAPKPARKKATEKRKPAAEEPGTGTEAGLPQAPDGV